MKKIYIYQKDDGTAPFLQFLNSLEPKARVKLERGLLCIATQPGYMVEPHIKHFSIEKYHLLWEYREHVRVPIELCFFWMATISSCFPYTSKSMKKTQGWLSTIPWSARPCAAMGKR